MKKIFGFCCVLLSLASCKKEIPVYGDKNAKPTLSVIEIMDNKGNDYSIQIANCMTEDTVLNSGLTAKLTTFPLMKFRRYASKVTIHINSNSRWTATPPYKSTDSPILQWFMNEKTNFIGEGKVEHVIPERTANSTRQIRTVYYTTLDSSQILKFYISQMGKTEDPN